LTVLEELGLIDLKDPMNDSISFKNRSMKRIKSSELGDGGTEVNSVVEMRAERDW